MTSLNEYIEQVKKDFPDELNLTYPEHENLIWKLSTNFVNLTKDLEEVRYSEKSMIQRNKPVSIFILLALKIAQSRLIINSVDRPILISVVFAVYKEHNRIKTSDQHPHGEDFLRRKADQMEKLCKENPHVDWELILVDDGCPENSGKIAEEIVNKEGLDHRIRVLFLDDAIKSQIPVVRSIRSTNDSQKGGAIVYGMWDAIKRKEIDNHFVIYTDADLSTHLGQMGLLLKPLIHGEQLIAIGSRREKNSVVIKKGIRNDRGKLFIYLWKRLIKPLDNIIDTQCGFKAFNKEILVQIIENLLEKKFAFDIELLLKAELLSSNTIDKVGIAWIDSEAASTTTDLQPYLPMLKKIVMMYRRYLPSSSEADAFANFIEKLDENTFQALVENIPEEITQRDPSTFGQFNDVNVDQLKTCIK